MALRAVQSYLTESDEMQDLGNTLGAIIGILIAASFVFACFYAVEADRKDRERENEDDL